MKIVFKVLLFQFILIASLSAKPFLITGSISGKEVLKFVYIFDCTDGNIIKIAPIINNKFLIKGEYAEQTKFGNFPSMDVLFLKDSLSKSVIDQRMLTSQRNHYVCTVMAAPVVSINYDTDKKYFVLKGSEQNKVQNLYLNRLSQYRNTRDSLFKLVRLMDLNDSEKTKKYDQIWAETFTETMRDFIKIVKKYPDRVSLCNFNPIVYDLRIPGQEVLTAFYLFPAEIRNSQYGKSIYKDIQDKLRMEELMAKPAYSVGQTFPSFSLPDIKDEKKDGRSLFGKYTLVDFWATWCGPCRKETPNLINAYEDFHQKGFNVITVSIDNKENKNDWIKALNDDKMGNFSNLFNGSDETGLARELKVLAIPMNFLLDENGKIVARNLRGEQLIKKLKELLPSQ